MSQTTFIHHSRGEISEHDTVQCSQLYPTIWAEPPWDETFLPQEVYQTITRLQQEKRSEIIMARQESAIVGFSWGYTVTSEDILSISGQKELKLALKDSAKLFYISELGIDRHFRHAGIGRSLSSLLIEAAHARFGTETVILRTDKQAHAARRLYEKIGFRELPFADKLHPNRTYWRLGLN